MTVTTPSVDPILFERQLQAFRSFVQEKSGVPFTSFAANPYTDEQEGYKAEVYRSGRNALAFQSWTTSAIGAGSIAASAIKAIEVPTNNLVAWQPRYGDAKRPHHELYEAQADGGLLTRTEAALFGLYRSEFEETSFNELLELFGRNYPLLAYLFFLKDRSRYLPIAPATFDRAFHLLGVDFKTARRCSWANYSTFLALISSLKGMIYDELQVEVSLLDAHSFVWILARQMRSGGSLANVDDYLALSASERDALVKARIGQGQFRQALLDYWGSCSVTGCTQPLVLRASHIKPWRQSSTTERMSLFNGLLLSPSLDACFDSGLISFSDEGEIIVSGRLTMDDSRLLGLSHGLKLRRVEEQHRAFLRFHRENIFN